MPQSTLLRRIHEKQSAERPERLSAERLFGFLLDDDDATAGVRDLRRGDEAREPGADDDDVGVSHPTSRGRIRYVNITLSSSSGIAPAARYIRFAGSFVGLVRTHASWQPIASPCATSVGDDPSANALVVVRRCDGDFVDPELGRLVGVHVVNAGCHADDEVAVERDGEVVARVGEELRAPARVDWIVEDVVGDVRRARELRVGPRSADGDQLSFRANDAGYCCHPSAAEDSPLTR